MVVITWSISAKNSWTRKWNQNIYLSLTKPHAVWFAVFQARGRRIVSTSEAEFLIYRTLYQFIHRFFIDLLVQSIINRHPNRVCLLCAFDSFHWFRRSRKWARFNRKIVTKESFEHSISTKIRKKTHIRSIWLGRQKYPLHSSWHVSALCPNTQVSNCISRKYICITKINWDIWKVIRQIMLAKSAARPLRSLNHWH